MVNGRCGWQLRQRVPPFGGVVRGKEGQICEKRKVIGCHMEKRRKKKRRKEKNKDKDEWKNGRVGAVDRP